MQAIEHIIALDFSKDIYTTITINQYDKDIRLIKASCYYDGNPVTFSTSDTYSLEIHTPSGKNYSYDSIITPSGNLLSFTLPATAAYENGRVKMDIKITYGTTVIYTGCFYVVVSESAVTDESVISEDEGRLIDKYINAAKEAQEAAEEALEAAEKSEANAKESEDNAKVSETNSSASATLSQSWAVGGTESRTGEDTNNSKYWANVYLSEKETHAISFSNETISSITFNDKDGVFTLTYADSTEENPHIAKIDTAIEKTAINFRYDQETQDLVLTLEDGTEQRISLASLIQENEFVSSSTVTLTVDATTHKVTASIPNNAITEDQIASDYTTMIKASAKDAKSYAVGGVKNDDGSDWREGQDTDNAKYYNEQAKLSAEAADASAKSIEGSVEQAAESASEAKTSADNAKASEDTVAKAVESVKTSEENAKASEVASKTSEDNAKASETASKTSEDNAKTAETNALAYSNQASSSATNAAASETNIKGAETYVDGVKTDVAAYATTIAETKKSIEKTATDVATDASTASTAATNAGTSETNSKNYADTAKSYAVGTEGVVRSGDDKDNAKYYAEQAANSAKSAQDSSTAASNAASNASSSAIESKTAASNADAYQQNASISATSAKASENAALSSANSASSSATQAKTSEDNAKTAETNASTSSQNASDSASAASKSETNAKESETAASTSATNAGTSESNAKGYADKTKEIYDNLNGTFAIQKTITFEELPSQEKAAGYAYVISNDFTTDSSFVTPDKDYKAGTIVYYTKNGKWDVFPTSYASIPNSFIDELFDKE